MTETRAEEAGSIERQTASLVVCFFNELLTQTRCNISTGLIPKNKSFKL